MLKTFVKPLVLIPLLVVTNQSSGVAETYWLNIPESHRQVDDKFFPASSYATDSQEACAKAMVEYAKMGVVNFIGCDIKPLPNAANLVTQLQ